MNKMYSTATLFLFAAVQMFGQLSGVVTVGSGGAYTTLSAAITVINTDGISGNVELSILNSFPDVGTPLNPASPLSGSLLIRPASSSTSPVITFTNSDGLVINGASNVTINGDKDSDGGRDLTLALNSSSVGSSTIHVMTSTRAVSSFTVRNCIIGDAINPPDFGIRLEGSSGNMISTINFDNNEIHGTGETNGIIYLNYVDAQLPIPFNIMGVNTIIGEAGSATQAIGINMDNCPSLTFISRNRLHTLQTTGMGDIIGLRQGASSSGELRIYNNMIGGNFSATGTPGNVHLIELNGSGTAKVYHNTAVLNDFMFFDTDNTAAVLKALNSTVDVRNNILINELNTNVAYCFLTNGTVVATSDNNNLFVSSGSGMTGSDGTTNSSTLTDWQNDQGLDLNSGAFFVDLVDPLSDFHLAAGSDGNPLLLAPPLADVVSDIYGTSRRTGTEGPYMGADEGSTALPVELISFSASQKQNGVELKWMTATEVNNYGFEVERKKAPQTPRRRALDAPSLREGVGDGLWGAIGFVEGNGTTNSPKSYSFVDGTAKGRAVYRLKQIDNDGKFSYSQAVEIETSAPKRFVLRQNFPNPFNPATTIEFELPASGFVLLSVYDLLGREVATLLHEELNAGLYSIQFNASNLSSGTYLYTLKTGPPYYFKKVDANEVKCFPI